MNLIQNRFEGLEVMGIADQKSETNKPTKHRSKTKKQSKLINHGLKNNPVELSFIKNLSAELVEPKVKTKDEGGKGINVPPTLPDNSTQDTSQDKNTEQNNWKIPIYCTEHRKNTE